MRRNHKTRPSSLVENYDVIYDFLPDLPHVSRIIDHPRKLVTVNRCADPFCSKPREIPHERAAAGTERSI